MGDTNIGWTDKVWNWVSGCVRVSPGCLNCYAERNILRWAPKTLSSEAREALKFKPGREIDLRPEKLNDPLGWTEPKMVFVNSMSDLFLDAVPRWMLRDAWSVMKRTPRHTYQILTKRPIPALRIMTELDLEPLPNVWIGVSVEDQKWADIRIPQLMELPASLHFVSVEPMLGPVDLSPYLGYNPRYESNRQDGTVRVPGSPERGDRDSRGRDGVAGDRGTREQMELGIEASSGLSPATGPDDQQRLSNGEDHEATEAGNDTCPSPGLAAHSRPNTEGSDNQSQEWDTGRQSTGELGTSDSLRTATPFNRRPQDVSDASAERRGEYSSEVDGERYTGNQTSPAPGAAATSDRSQVQRQLSSNIEDREAQKMGARGLMWAIVGGESGPGYRPFESDWARAIRDQCVEAEVAFFFKQYAGTTPGGNSVLDGQIWHQFPGNLAAPEQAMQGALGI